MRYLRYKPDFTLKANLNHLDPENVWKFYVDSDVAGAHSMSTRSRAGVLFLLNNMPILWKSCKMPITAFSSAAAEIWAFSQAVKEAQSILWRAADLGAPIKYPFDIYEDNSAAVTFQKTTSPSTKLKGVFNLMDAWIRELKDSSKIRAVKIPSNKNPSNTLTKCQQASELRSDLKLISM
jgi:hypothetical protein